jgi:hypothetical protein
MKVSYVVGQRTREHSFASMYRVYSVSTDNISMGIYEVYYTLHWRRFMIDYSCVLLMSDGVNVSLDASIP